MWLEEQKIERLFDGGGKPFANIFGDGESMEKKTSRIKERFLPVSFAKLGGVEYRFGD